MVFSTAASVFAAVVLPNAGLTSNSSGLPSVIAGSITDAVRVRQDSLVRRIGGLARSQTSYAGFPGGERRPAPRAAEPVVLAGQSRCSAAGPIGTVMPHTGSMASTGPAFAAGRVRLPSRTAAISSAAMDTAISAGVLAPIGNPTGVCMRARSASDSSSWLRIDAPRTLLATRPMYPTP